MKMFGFQKSLVALERDGKIQSEHLRIFVLLTSPNHF